MLYEEIGVEPQSLLDPQLGSHLRNSFGFDKGRLVSRYPRDWIGEVRMQINQLNDENLRIRLKNLLNSAQFLNLLVDFDRPNPRRGWLESALELHQEKPFNAILSASNNQPPLIYDVEHIQDLIDKSDENTGYLEVKSKKVPELVLELTPFLKLNKTLVLENYSQTLLTSEKTRPLFESVFRNWQRTGGMEFKLIVSKRLNQRNNIFEQECKLLGKFLADTQFNGTFKYILIDDERNKLHERYFLGGISGIELGYGLETSSYDHSWKVLNKATHSALKRKYLDADIRDEYPEYMTFMYQKGKTTISSTIKQSY